MTANESPSRLRTFLSSEAQQWHDRSKKDTRKSFLAFLAIVGASMAILPILAASQTGNGAPTGAHFNLNIIGVPKEKNGDEWDNKGHRIFVKLWGAYTKIWLVRGDAFNVIDPQCTDGNATLQLVDPYPGTTTTAVYKIYVIALGKPDGSAKRTPSKRVKFKRICFFS